MVNDKRKKELEKFAEEFGIEIHNLNFLDKALTHSSYTFENKLSTLGNNERLEFLGDAVLKLIASRYLYERFPEYPEGELTKIRSILISDSALSKLAEKIKLGNYLKLGFHEEKLGGRKRPSTLACSFEAILGAYYLDGKLSELYKILSELIDETVTEIDKSASKYNCKAMLQEYVQANGLELPTYKTIKEEGPPHNKTFSIEVYVDNMPMGIGCGKSKKEAHQKAAQVAVQKLGLLGESNE